MGQYIIYKYNTKIKHILILINTNKLFCYMYLNLFLFFYLFYNTKYTVNINNKLLKLWTTVL